LVDRYANKLPRVMQIMARTMAAAMAVQENATVPMMPPIRAVRAAMHDAPPPVNRPVDNPLRIVLLMDGES
jgi:hypothetical protein